MQNVSRRGVRMLTLSTSAPSARRSTNLWVLPSGLWCTDAVSGRPKSQMAGSERQVRHVERVAGALPVDPGRHLLGAESGQAMAEHVTAQVLAAHAEEAGSGAGGGRQLGVAHGGSVGGGKVRGA